MGVGFIQSRYWQKGDNEMNKKNVLPLVWFVLGFGIFMSTRASNFIPHWDAAIVIAPVFVLAFARSLPTKKANLLTLLGFLLSFNIALWGLFDMGDEIATMLYNLVRSSAIALLYSLPYMVDRTMYPKLGKRRILSTLTFPIASTAVMFLISLEGPFDGDMITSVYGYGHLVFKQLASIAGLFGFVFIFSWFASVANYAWEERFSWGQIKTVALSFSLVLLALLLFGVVKTASLTNPEPDTVQVAAIFLLPEDGKGFDPDGLFSKDPSPYEKTVSEIGALAAQAASNGAKIVAFQETAIKINEQDESTLIKDLTTMAVENDIYLSLGYGVFPNEGKGWNKAILISNQGVLEVDYRKRYLLGMGDLFGETLIYRKGPEVIQSVETPYGRIAVSICRDMSFASYARQAGEQQVDIMLDPSYDVPKSGGPMYALRAIENGFSMVRPVYNGYSFAVDYNGKLLADMDSDRTDTGIMYADVPTKGVNTLYARIGDLFGWICVFGLFGFIPLSIILSARQKKRMHQDRSRADHEAVWPSA
jgi:apolipoprotein N-acyltransferase